MPSAQLLGMVNAHLQAFERTPMPADEFNLVLDDLKRLRCVGEQTQTSDSVYWLVETVHVRLED